MKLRHSLSIFGLVTMLGLGVGVGLTSAQKPVEEAKAGTSWYYRGSDTSKTPNWATGSESYKIEDGAEASVWTFVVGENFKFVDKKDGWDDVSTYSVTILGTASGLFGGGGTENIEYRGSANASFNVVLNSGNIYFDYQDGAVFYYNGSDTDKATTAWTHYTDKPITVNGSAVNMTFKKGETFKLRPAIDDNSWHGAIGTGNLKSSYYKIFTGDGDIFVNHEFSYNISLVALNHELKINIVANAPTSNTVYVLDLYGDLLNGKHNAHYFNNTDSIETDWPGVEMGVVPTTSNVYSVTYWDAFDKVIFNQVGDGDKTGQTIDLTLTGNEGKCLILNHDVNGQYKWNSNTWLSLDAAKFIDGYMKFNEYDENTYNDEETGVTANCDANWTAAKTAYNALASNAVRLEVLSIAVVKTRLGNWAAAHGAILNDSGAAITPRAPVTIANATEQSSTNTTLIIAIVASSVAALALIGGYFYFRKRKEDR